MVFKIHGVKGFSGTQNVLVVAEELKDLGYNVPYEVITVDMFNQAHREKEYIKTMHPFGQTPVLVDEDRDGFVLCEGRAIARYLAILCDAESLYPRKDIKKAALFEQAESFEHANFHAICSTICTELIYKPGFFLQPTNEDRAKEAIAKLDRCLEAYEIILGKSNYLAGDDVTLADLMHLANGHVLENYLGLDCLRTRPKVARWWENISSRPSWKRVKEIAESDMIGVKLPPREKLDLGSIISEATFNSDRK